MTQKGQITLPAELRAKLHITPGMKVEIGYENQVLVIKPAVDLVSLRLVAQAAMKARGISRVTDDDIDRAVGDAARD